MYSTLSWLQVCFFGERSTLWYRFVLTYVTVNADDARCATVNCASLWCGCLSHGTVSVRPTVTVHGRSFQLFAAHTPHHITSHRSGIRCSHCGRYLHRFTSGTDLIQLLVVLVVVVVLLFLLVGGDHLKTLCSVVSNHIGMKFGRKVPQVSSGKYVSIDGVGFRFEVTPSKRQPWCHFALKSAATWWVLTMRYTMSGAYATMSASSWSIVHSYLL